MSSIIDWLSGIVAKIADLPGLIFDKFRETLNSIGQTLGGIAGAVYGFFKPFIEFVQKGFNIVTDALGKIGKTIFDSFVDTLRNIIDAVLGIPEAIFNFLKKLFIPEKEDITACMDRLNNSFKGLLYSYDLTGLATGSKEMTDIKCTLYGKEVTILDASLVLKGIGYFRSIIRGFLALLLILFNINQFLGFIGQPAISIVGGIKAHQEYEAGKITELADKGGTWEKEYK